MLSLLNKFQWQGSERVYSLPWLRNRIEYSAEPDRVKEYASGCRFTRSQLSRDMLTRFHLSNHSIVVSDDEHAQELRQPFRESMPSEEDFPEIARNLVNAVFETNREEIPDRTLHLSSELIREVYLSLLSNLLGANVLKPLEEHIKSIDFQPGTRPVHLEGVMYALGLQLPGFAPMRTIVDLLFFRGEHHTRQTARKLENMVFEFATPKQNSWYAMLLDLKKNGQLTRAQLKGELTGVLVSAYSLSAAMSSMLLCIAARQEYIHKIRDDESMAKCFVYEVLRLYPPFRQFGYEEKNVWSKGNRSKEEATDFMVSTYALHRNEDAWEDPDSFHPERFLTPGATGGFKFLPFGMGGRSCIGRMYSVRMLTEVIKYVCSEDFDLNLELPEDYDSDQDGLPIGTSGRLVSFPIDDKICVRKAN
ncbi:cytochrome P450 [Pseudomonadota bacterium]